MRLKHASQVYESLSRLHNVFKRMSSVEYMYNAIDASTRVHFVLNGTYQLMLVVRPGQDPQILEQIRNEPGDKLWGETPAANYHLALFQGKVRNAKGEMVTTEELKAGREAEAAVLAYMTAGVALAAKAEEKAKLEADFAIARMSEKMRREAGLCTCIAHSDKTNATRIKYIVDTFIEWYYGKTLGDYVMEAAPRATNDWRQVQGLPCDFNGAVYRLRKYEDEPEEEVTGYGPDDYDVWHGQS